MLPLLVTANVVPSSPIVATQMMEVICSFQMPVLTTATWHNIPEDGILHSHCHENLKSYKSLLSITYSMTLISLRSVQECKYNYTLAVGISAYRRKYRQEFQ
jgi:hypothetical protein